MALLPIFMATNESTANTILDHDGTRYVITDIEMDTGKFWAMATWFNPTLAGAPYQMTVLIPGQTASSSYQLRSPERKCVLRYDGLTAP